MSCNSTGGMGSFFAAVCVSVLLLPDSVSVVVWSRRLLPACKVS